MEHLQGVLAKLLTFSEDKLPKIKGHELLEQPKLIEGMPPEVYHGDKARMSSSGVRKVLQSPRHFLTMWCNEVEEDKDHFRIGRAAHLLLLEPEKFRELYLVQPDFGAMQSSKNRAARDEWRSQQHPQAVIVTEKELNNLVGMAEAVLEHPIASALLKNGKPETTLHWTDEDTGVYCKARPDYISVDPTGDVHLIDFKTTRDIRSGIFADDAYRMRYGTQLAFYHDGLVRAMGRQPTTVTLIAVEKEPPFEAAVYCLTDDWIERGQEEYQHALRIYRRCRDTGKFPAHQSNASILNMPRKAQYDSLPQFEF
jgi:hypothetical protein